MQQAVKLEGLVKSYGPRFTLGPLTLRLTKGVTCIVGPNGAGKSTLLSLICGTQKPSSGSVVCDPSDRQVGFLPQDYQLPKRATGEDFLTYVSWLQGIPKADRAEFVTRALEEVGLGEVRSTPIGELSHGMAKRIGIAQALVHNPGLVVLDEPTAGLDPIQRVTIRQLVGGLGANRVACVSTHLVEDIRGLADRVLVLNGGQMIYDGDVAGLEALSNPGAPGDTELERALSSLMTAVVA